VTTAQLHLTFPGHLERERTVATLRTSFPLQVNIRRANVEEQSAWFIVDVTGDEDVITRAVEWLLDEGVLVDRIPIDG
jgi:antibiotic biosynthesis monooxygenase (ABM) superfamily enzyme